MAFDKNLDKEIYGETIEFETSKLRVSVFSYNGGKAKLQISRESLDPASGEFRFGKLGRLTKEEAEKVLPLFQEAMKHL